MGSILPDSISVSSPRDMPMAQNRSVSENYFALMGIPVLSGRSLTEGTQGNSPPEVVISRSLARQYWPHTSALGHGLRFDLDAGSQAYTIVGVVGDVDQNTFDQPLADEYYLSYWNAPDRSMAVIVKTSLAEAAMNQEVETALRSIDPDQPIANIASFDQMVQDATHPEHTRFTLLALISGTALLLTAIGVFGLISYSVQRRAKEISIRLAMGSGRIRILLAIFRDLMLLVFAGIVFGIVIALALFQFIKHLLLDVPILNPSTYLEAILLLILVALAASTVPALRAASVDPASTLRAE